MKGRNKRMTPQNDAMHHIEIRCDKKSALEAKHINPIKGRGVFALQPFSKGDFVVEYRGKRTSPHELERSRNSMNSVFVFDFIWQDTKLCIDATEEDDSIGRLVNDDNRTPNCNMKKIVAQGKPHLCLFALRDIIPGEEITYNYGGSDWPWREKAASHNRAKLDQVSPSTETEGAASHKRAKLDQVSPSTETEGAASHKRAKLDQVSPSTETEGIQER